MAGERINLGGKGRVLQAFKPQPVVLNTDEDKSGKLFRSGREPLVAISPRFELLIHVGAFGVGGEECSVFVGGHVKVLIDLARLTKLQFQDAFLGSVANAGDTAGLYRNSLHSRIERLPGALSPWMRMTSRKELAHLYRRSQPDAYTFIHCAPKTAKFELRPQARHWRSN
jgi:hypothetical protein